MSSTLDVQTPEFAEPLAEQTALASYLGMVVAIGNCVSEVFPAVGAMYRDRLLRLPRRLGFDPTPEALEQSREAVEMDLAEFAATAGALIQAGTTHAAYLLEHLRTTEETLLASSDLQRAFHEDIAEHMEASAEVDDEAQLRVSFRRYATGLRAYSRRASAEKLATIAGFANRRQEIEEWLLEATVSDFTDPESGLLNRAAAERRIRTEIGKQRRFCVIVARWTTPMTIPEQWRSAVSCHIIKELAERLGATIRPYDVVFRWSQDEVVTIFEAPEAVIAARARQIGGWLGEATSLVNADGKDVAVPTSTTVSIVEHANGESAAQLAARIESLSHQSVG